MQIVYDPHKRDFNLAKHGYDFAELDEEYFAAAVVIAAKRGRHMAIGHFRGDAVAVVFSRLGREAISVLSMRRANRKERRIL